MTRLFEFIGKDLRTNNLPGKAGVVDIVWINMDGCSKPQVIKYGDKQITLAYIPHAEYFPLKGGQHFIYCIDGVEPYYFCGENNGHAFAIALRPNVFNKRAGYEKNFYKNLKPPIIEIAENTFSKEVVMYDELLVVPVPLSLEDIEKTSSLHNLRSEVGQHTSIVSSNNEIKVIISRYKLIGRIIHEILLFGVETAQICEGKIVTPKRCTSGNPLELDGVNIVVMMNHLYSIQPQFSDPE